jgi:hypothetical protein
MPIGVTLVDLRRDLRAETGQSLNPAQGVQSQSTQDILLDRQQRELWDAYQWPHLRYFVDVPLLAGQETYAYPEVMPFDQVSRIFIAMGTNTSWSDPLAYGIRAFDIPVGGSSQGTPKRWANKVQITAGGITDPAGLIQLLPIPSSNGTMRLEGQAPCTNLVSDTDRCILDSKAIVLFAAAEILATQKGESASLKLTKAQNYLRRLLQNQGADKRANYNMGGNHRVDHLGKRPYASVPGIDYIPS